MKWQATNMFSRRSNGLCQGHFVRFTNPFRNFLVPYFDPFSISAFSCLEELLHHLAQKGPRSSLKNEFWRPFGKTEFISIRKKSI